jgi:hypothetical protein
MAVYAMMFMGIAPIGALAAGMVAGHIGAPLTLTFGGAVCVIAGLAFRQLLPTLLPRARELVRDAADASEALPQLPAQASSR